MFDPWLLGVRLALYLGLMLGFGLPVFALNSLRGEDATPAARPLLQFVGAISAFNLLTSCLGLWAMSRSMSGSNDLAAVQGTLRILLTQTQIGAVWIVRIGLLVLSTLVAMLPTMSLHLRFGILALLGAGALATLAWTGHGAMSEGTAAWFHLGTTIVHLLAAGAWFGSLVALALIARQAQGKEVSASVRLLSSASSGFARMGSLSVAALLISGIINYLFIVGPSLSGLVSGRYGQLLLIKLGLFTVMLALAAANRFRLAPALECALQQGDTENAVTRLQRSLRVETGSALVIIALVAGLGTLDPAG